MRLNWFLPSLKRSEGKPGIVRRGLARIGPSWALSPVRRIVQAASLALFLWLLFYVCWAGKAAHHASVMEAREAVEAETFLMLDPLVSLGAAIAAREWIWPLIWAAAILAVCLVIPRGFCGYLCPLGTVIDLFDAGVGRRFRRFHLQRRGWWVHLRYYVLVAALVAAAFGALVTGFVAPIPVLTRAMVFALGPVQAGFLRGWQLVPPVSFGQFVAVGMFALILTLGFLGARFWCRCVCPTGAIFSAANVLRLTERRVLGSCVGCGKCVTACSFDAIKPDFTTRAGACTFCQACGGVCPVGAIEFGRRRRGAAEPSDDSPVAEARLSRRGFLAGTAAGLATALSVNKLFGATGGGRGGGLPVRPPGSAPEEKFLSMCVRCGACMKACPTNVLQPLGLRQGLAGVWTPHAVADWSGCDPSCNLCGQVCPTGAIRTLPLNEKRTARMGLARVNDRTCLPHAGRQPCQMCVEACSAAGYHAVEFIRVGVEVGEDGMPVEDTGFDAPRVLANRCVGCGLCQSRCYGINVAEKRLLEEAAVRVVAGPGREDRIMRGSYRALREAERRRNRLRRSPRRGETDRSSEYLPEFLTE